MEKEKQKNSRTILKRALTVVIAVLCVFGIKTLMGTRTMMYLYARDIDHIDVTVTPPGVTMTAVGDDSAAVVSLLSKAVTHGRKEPVTGQTISLTIYNLDESVQQVNVCGDYLEVDGKGYKMRLPDGEAIAAWAQALAEKQGVSLE
mgnify:FL=1